MKILKSLLIGVFLLFLGYPSYIYPWDLLLGGDHLGQDWVLPSTHTVSGIHTNIRQFRINSGSTVTVQSYNGVEYGSFEVHASSIEIRGTLRASGTGFRGGVGGKLPSISAAAGEGSSGGSAGVTRGGAIEWSGSIGGGGGKASGAAGLITYPPSSDDIDKGSGGGGGGSGAVKLDVCDWPPPQGGVGGNGGGSILLVSSSTFLSGSIESKGSDGAMGKHFCGWSSAGGGGGSGGSILINTKSLFGNGSLNVDGGAVEKNNIDSDRIVLGGGADGEFGSGGRIKIFYENKFQDLKFGQNGTVYFNQVPSVPQPLSTSERTLLPLFEWSKSIDLEGPQSLSYELQVSSDPTFFPLKFYTQTFDSFYQSTQSLVGLHYWRVRANDSELISNWSHSFEFHADTIPPSTVGFSSIKSEIASLSVDLLKSSDSISGLNEYPYFIEISTHLNFLNILKNSNWISTTSWRVESLSPNTTYYLRTKVRDSVLNETSWVESQKVTLAQFPREIKIMEIGSSSVTVSWKSSAPENPPNTLYSVLISSAHFLSENEIVSSGEILKPNTTYFISVAARNWEGVESATGIAAVTLALPPINLHASLLTASTIQISFENSGNPEGSSYEVELSTISNFESRISSITKNLSVLVKNLSANTPYYYRVAGINWEGKINFSNIISTHTFTHPPQKLDFGSIGENFIETKWDANSNPASTEYQVEYSSDANFLDFEPSNSWQEEDSYQFNSLSPNTTYWFRVKSRNRERVESPAEDSGPVSTLAKPPPVPLIEADFNEVLGYHVRIIPSYGDNHPDTDLAIQNVDTGEYLQGNGATNSKPVWKKKSDWVSGNLTNAEGALGGMNTYRYQIWARNFSELIQKTPSSVALAITPPAPPSIPLVKEKNDSTLEVSIQPIIGAEKYWVYFATWGAAPSQNFVHIGTITPSATTFLEDLKGGIPGIPIVSINSLSINKVSVSWSAPIIPWSEPRFYKVCAIDNFGRSGQKSGVGIGASQVSPVISGYGIHRNGVFISSTTTTSYEDLSIQPGKSYLYSIVAISNQGFVGSSGKAGINIDSEPPVEFLQILEGCTLDLDEDGLVEAFRLKFNKELNDSSVLPADFMVASASTQTAVSFLSGYSGDETNDRILTLNLGRTYDSSFEPILYYKGSSLYSLDGKYLAESVVKIEDKVAPVIRSLEASSDQRQAIVKINLSENISEEFLNKFYWKMESPPGRALDLDRAEIKFSSSTLGVQFILPYPLSLAEALIVKGNLLRDNKNNVRQATLKKITSWEFRTVTVPIFEDVTDARMGPNPWEAFRTPKLILDQLPQEATIEIYNIIGEKVYSIEIKNGNGLWEWNGLEDNGEPLSSGVYFVLIKNSNSIKRIPLTIIR